MLSFVPALRMLVALTLLTGVFYPLVVTGVAQLLFRRQAEGSLVEQGGKVVGSRLIGQPFTSPGYFWSRPSATGPFPYNAGLSSGSNLGPIHPDLASSVQARIAALRAADSTLTGPVPVDLVTASGSGLDPHISVAAALVQVRRVARARGLSEDSLRAIVARHASGRGLGRFGNPAVHVLELNLVLDGNPILTRSGVGASSLY